MASNLDQLTMELETLLRKFSTEPSSIVSHISEVDAIYGEILGILFPNDPTQEPTIDASVYDRLDKSIQQIRLSFKGLAINNFILTEKVAKLEQDLKKINDIIEQNRTVIAETRNALNEIQFCTLAYAITVPLKQQLDEICRSRYSHSMELCSRQILLTLRRNLSSTANISSDTLAKAVDVYDRLAKTLGISKNHLVDVMLIRVKRNSSQHDFLKDYLIDCEIDNKQCEV